MAVPVPAPGGVVCVGNFEPRAPSGICAAPVAAVLPFALNKKGAFVNGESIFRELSALPEPRQPRGDDELQPQPPEETLAVAAGRLLAEDRLIRKGAGNPRRPPASPKARTGDRAVSPATRRFVHDSDKIPWRYLGVGCGSIASGEIEMGSRHLAAARVARRRHAQQVARTAESLDDYARTGLPGYRPRNVARNRLGWLVEDGKTCHVHGDEGITQKHQPIVAQPEPEPATTLPPVATMSDATIRSLARRCPKTETSEEGPPSAPPSPRNPKVPVISPVRASQTGKRKMTSALDRFFDSMADVVQVAQEPAHEPGMPELSDNETAALTKVQARMRGVLGRRGFREMRVRRMMTVVSVLGGPGSGKTKYAKKLADETPRAVYIGIGELLRAAATVSTGRSSRHLTDHLTNPFSDEYKRLNVPNFDIATRSMIRSAMLDGGHVSDDIVLLLLENAIERGVFARSSVFILDNFPISETQELLWNDAVRAGKVPRIAQVFFMDCSEQMMVERVLGRADFTKRADDNEAAVSAAINRFRRKCKPDVIAKHFAAGTCTTIDAEGSFDIGVAQMTAALVSTPASVLPHWVALLTPTALCLQETVRGPDGEAAAKRAESPAGERAESPHKWLHMPLEDD